MIHAKIKAAQNNVDFDVMKHSTFTDENSLVVSSQTRLLLLKMFPDSVSATKTLIPKKLINWLFSLIK